MYTTEMQEAAGVSSGLIFSGDQRDKMMGSLGIPERESCCPALDRRGFPRQGTVNIGADTFMTRLCGLQVLGRSLRGKNVSPALERTTSVFKFMSGRGDTQLLGLVTTPQSTETRSLFGGNAQLCSGRTMRGAGAREAADPLYYLSGPYLEQIYLYFIPTKVGNQSPRKTREE